MAVYSISWTADRPTPRPLSSRIVFLLDLVPFRVCVLISWLPEPPAGRVVPPTFPIPSRMSLSRLQGIGANGIAPPAPAASPRNARDPNRTPPPVPPAINRARKIRCDRQQPQCSNCRRTDVECDFSTTLKRVDRTKQLLNDFTGVVARLDRIDISLNRLSEQLQRQQYLCLCSPANAAVSSPSFPSSAQLAPEGSKDQDPTEHPQGEVVDFEHGGQRMLGYPAALSLFKNLHRQITQSLSEGTSQMSGIWRVAAQQPGIKESLEGQLERFPFGGQCREPIIVSDRRRISTPPRYLLKLSLDNFLRNINIHTPIFDDASLEEAIESHYQSPSASNSDAWALIFTNIIVLTLALDSRVARAAASHLASMNDDILHSLLKNCDRALADLNEFTRPCATNAQMLLTLALVAREFYSGVVFEKVCQTACQVARSMGLHRAHGARSTSWEKMSDRERLFWVLYTMDKQRVFLTGQPCDLYLFDSDVQLSSCGERAPSGQRLNAAYVHMMTIWEKIYIHLYSSRAVLAGAAQRSCQVQQLSASLNEWNLQYHELLGSLFIEKVPDLAPLQLELKYCFMVSQVLVHRCDRNARYEQRYRNSARMALKLVSQVARIPNSCTPARCAVLARMLRNHPLVALHDLFSFCLAKELPENTEDGQLIYEMRHNLELLQHADFPDAYYARLEVGLKWCTELLDTIKDCLSKSMAASDWGPANGSSTGMSYRTPTRSTLETQSELSSCPVGQRNSAALTFAMDTDESLHALRTSVPLEGIIDPGFPVFGLTASSSGDGTALAVNHGLDHPVFVVHQSMWAEAGFPCNASSELFFDADFAQSIMPTGPCSAGGV